MNLILWVGLVVKKEHGLDKELRGNALDPKFNTLRVYMRLVYTHTHTNHLTLHLYDMFQNFKLGDGGVELYEC